MGTRPRRRTRLRGRGRRSPASCLSHTPPRSSRASLTPSASSAPSAGPCSSSASLMAVSVLVQDCCTDFPKLWLAHALGVQNIK